MVLISFEFSVGEPEIFVELILPALAVHQNFAHATKWYCYRAGWRSESASCHQPEGEMHWRLRDVQRNCQASLEENKNAD